MSAKKEKEIADALNTALKCNLHDAVGSAALTELITDYFCTPNEHEDGEGSDSSSSETEFYDNDDNADIVSALVEDAERLDGGHNVTTNSVSGLAEDAERLNDTPMVIVDEVSNVVMSNVLNHVVCTGVDDEMDCVKAFSCGCNTLCCNQFTQEFILRRPLDMKELTENAILILIS